MAGAIQSIAPSIESSTENGKDHDKLEKPKTGLQLPLMPRCCYTAGGLNIDGVMKHFDNLRWPVDSHIHPYLFIFPLSSFLIPILPSFFFFFVALENKYRTSHMVNDCPPLS
jgi:hypothetical protein